MPPIRLRLSLSSAAPATPTPAPTLPSSRKGKEKAAGQDDTGVGSTPTIRLRVSETTSATPAAPIIAEAETPLPRPVLKVKAPIASSHNRPTNGNAKQAEAADLNISTTVSRPSQSHARPSDTSPDYDLPVADSATPSAGPSTPVSIPRPSQSASKQSTKAKKIAKSADTRPRSLLVHALANPTTPQAPTPQPAASTPESAATPRTPPDQIVETGTPAIKTELEDDGIPAVPDDSRDQSVIDDRNGSAQPNPAGEFEDSIDISSELLPKRVARGRTGVKWTRIKRPLKDLLGKIMIELRRKDEYALFDEPVDPDNFPGYLEAVGGQDKMMDLGTMQAKIDDGAYRSLDQFETDLRLLAAAAMAFNPPGTIPHNSANRLLTHGLKHIERTRPIVLTPSPSPDRRGTSEMGTPWRDREATAATDEGQGASSVTPQTYIPEEMLLYPPNSAQALAIGWNLTGGKRVYAKRLIRGRERFLGKWRHWCEDGTRDLAELEDPVELLREWQTWPNPRRVVDWKGLRKDGTWWEFELGGPAGQPPVAFTPFPRPNALRTRQLGTFEWGVYPEVEAEIAILRSRNPGVIDEHGILERHLMAKARPPPPKNLVNIYEEDAVRKSGDYVRTMCAGELQGEAYMRSVRAFVHGAMEGARNPGMEDGSESKIDVADVSLDDFVTQHYRGGLLSHPNIAAADKAMAMLRKRPLDPEVSTIASRTYAATALHQLTGPTNPLDIVPFLREPKDFNHAGVAGKSGVQSALEATAAEIIRLAREMQTEREGKTSLKRMHDGGSGAPDGSDAKKSKLESASRESSPLSAPPDSPEIVEIKPDTTDTTGDAASTVSAPSKEEAMTKLRLELVALTKFYPLAALKRMTPAEAEKLLPVNVRHLMCRPPK